MRIISGKYKGRGLKGYDIDGTRPTMDRVKESLFALIQTEIKQKKCLDLFAGSGALGIEALSMGADTCVFIDNNPVAIQTITENTKMITGVTILKSDAFQIHEKINQAFDLVFLDPPYHEHLIAPSLVYLSEHQLLKEGAIVVCEYEEESFSNEQFEVIKKRAYGKKQIKVLKFQKK